MSIDRTDHIVHGWKLPYPFSDHLGNKLDYWDDKYLPMIEGHINEKFRLIVDGMCANYVVFGIVVESSGNKHEGWDFVQIPTQPLDVYELEHKYREVFNVPKEIAIPAPTLFIFSHIG